ncbi:MAG TPA: dienelactone hydrolase family protein [Caulobacteraceae bacterium]|jgi:carboxymethylenebutenolidase|nr:dienelactone hydrolase family protein [Caulobacteraceae bacterium]
MCDSDINRRAFTAASIAAGAALVAANVARAQEAGVTESEVQIKTPDGMTDAALYTPKGKGPFPGVLIFTDIFGLRPASRAVGRRLAIEGYVALVTNPFYRTKKGPVMEPAVQATFNFAKDGALLQPHMAVLTPEATTRDELAWLAYLDALPQVSKKAKLGVDGYCMGGPRVVQASALRPDRVGAAFTAHPGNALVTEKPDSPHLLAPKIKAKSFFAIAQNDAMQKPDLANQMKAAYAAAGNPCGAEVYKANHGWTMPDSAAYNKDEAERAWVQRLSLYKSALV